MIQKLISKIQQTKAPIVVGLDPMLGSLTVEHRKNRLQAA